MEKETDLNQIVANNLIDLRKEHGLTQQELAKKLNYSDKTISKWELGYMIPSVDVLLKLAEFYGVDLNYFTESTHNGLKAGVNRKDKNKTNKIIILALAVTGLWAIAAATFSYVMITTNKPIWTLFLWTLVVSCLVVALFIRWQWGKLTSFFVFLSAFVWSALLSAFIQVMVSNNSYMWYLFFIGIPLQVAIILWRFIK